ncbi:MAG: HAD family hydrolase [Candidatus Methanomethylophilaceae archaeon]|nr:HAD family hydrolase [Candidatus Methanomethylophilaceae archaeon]
MIEGIKAVGFDLDGTFMKTHVDYARLSVADKVVLESRGIPFDEVYAVDYIKRPRYPIREWLEAHGRGDEFQSVSDEIDRAFAEIEVEFVSEAVPFPGSLECLDKLKSKGLKTGILTRGCLDYARRVLGPTGALERLDAVMGRDHSSYDNAKPSPMAIQEFAEMLGVRPEEMLYVGDNVTDYMSAHGAGAQFAGVLTGSGSVNLWSRTDPSIIILDRAGDCVDLL